MAAYTGELVDTPDVSVAETKKAVSKTKAKSAPVAAAVPTPAVSAAPLAGDAVERVAQNVGKAATVAANAGSNATQSSLDYARDAIANNPELTGALAAIPVMYGANKLGLFDTLGSKMSSTAQPQPFVGGSGPRNTPPTISAAPIQDWGIHDEPPLFAPAAAPEVTAAPAAAPSRNLTLEEAQARMAGVTPAAPAAPAPVVAPVAPEVAPMQPIVPNAADQAVLADNEAKIAANDEKINKLLALQKQHEEFIRAHNEGRAPITPARPVTPTPPATLASTETAATPPTEAATPKKRGPAPAEPVGNYPKKTTFKTAAEIPEGFVFRPDVGNLDRSMYNILGPEHRQQAKEFLTGGQMFGHSADVNADVSKLTNQYFQRLQSEVPETILGRDARKLQNVPSDFGVYGGKGGFGKAAKVAGVAGTLFAAADLANAATNAAQGKYGEAAGQALDVASGFIPPVAQFLTHIGNAGESPEEQARFERQRNYALKAGRGVAQGYDPRRLIGVAPPAR